MRPRDDQPEDRIGIRVREERPDAAVARITLARPERRNAQDRRLLYDLNDAFDRAARDETVKVIILAADGPDFSSGHDLDDLIGIPTERVVGPHGGFDRNGAEGYFAEESEVYLGLCQRWRDIPKPTIAAVQGRCIAGALMLVWPCDLIIASNDAQFSDPVCAMGIPGHEYFVHPYEVGHRKAKEMLFTGQPIAAAEALALGMVNQVVPRAELAGSTLALATRIARRPSFGLTLAKRAVNQSLDAMGQTTVLWASFGYHHLAHAHNKELHGTIYDPAALQMIRDNT